MPSVIVSGVDYPQFFDDLRAVIRHEIKQAQLVDKDAESLITKLDVNNRRKGKRQGRKEVSREA